MLGCLFKLTRNDGSIKVDFALVNGTIPDQTDHKELNSDFLMNLL